MRVAIAFLCATMLAPALAFGQEDRPQNAAQVKPQTYIVEITELQLSEEAAQKIAPKDIAKSFEQLKKDGKFDRLETIRLSVLSHQETMVQFAKQTSITQGTVTTREGRQRNTAMARLGTLVQISAQPRDEQVFLNLKYEVSRLGEIVPEDTSPDIDSIAYSSGMLVQPGKPTLVVASLAKKATYLLVSIVE